MVVFDKAYNHYKLFTKWTEKQIWFVTFNVVYKSYHQTEHNDTTLLSC